MSKLRVSACAGIYPASYRCFCILALAAALAFAPLGSAFAQSPSLPDKESRPMKIRLLIQGKALPARLDDTPAARDFYAMLPLSLTLEDYAATEKIAYPPRKLNIAGAPEGFTPSPGDITYYAPWGNLALFHKGFHYSSGLVSLGRLESGVEVLRTPGKLSVRIERAD